MAYAADVPLKAPPAAAKPFNWTGCYFGGFGGENWGHSSHVATTANNGAPITNDFGMTGGIAGGAAGCNYEVSNILVGVEADYAWTDTKGSASDLPPFTVAATSATREKWMQTLRGRVGYAFDRFAIYGTAGAATAGTAVDISNPAFGNIENTQSRTGWTAGAGGEWAAWTAPWGALTVRLEYLHADFGSREYVNPPVVTSIGSTIVTRNVKLNDDVVRVGMNLLFNMGSSPSAEPPAK